MTFVVGLGQPAGSDLVGGKFASLQRVARTLPVPDAVCVTTNAFAAALDERQHKVVAAFFEDVRATIGTFLIDEIDGFHADLGPLQLPEAVADELSDALASRSWKRSAVRSSAVGEDSSSSSAAGVYESYLDVDADGVVAAIEACWRSYYSARAITARVRAGDFSPQPCMAVIVQELVDARLAGVAFTEGPTDRSLEIEYCEGRGDALVAGLVPALRYPADGAPAPLVEVARIAGEAEQTAGHPVDMEWAWDGEAVRVLQVRPVTTARRSTGPLLMMARLYLDDLPDGFELGDCREVYGQYVAKRRHAYLEAARHSIATGAGVVVHFDRAGLDAEGPELPAALGATAHDEVVVDLGGALRQQVLPASELVSYLRSLCTGDSDRQTAVVRRFVRGTLGVITRLVGPDQVLVEVSTDGLLAMNRGIARCEAFSLPADGSGEPPALVAPMFAALARFTRVLDAWRPGVHLEWSCDGDVAYFVDFSVSATEVDTTRLGTCMAPGSASGPLLVLDDDVLLERLSVSPGVSIDKQHDVGEHRGLRAVIDQVRQAGRPIVRTTRPYAVLSLIFDDVAGFVFESGSQLCHLAILLREAQLPAAVAPQLPRLGHGDEILVVDGDVHAVVGGAR